MKPRRSCAPWRNRRRINFSFAPTISRMPRRAALVPAALRKRAAKFRMQSCRNETLDRFACLLSFSLRNVNSSKSHRYSVFFGYRSILRLKMQIGISIAMVGTLIWAHIGAEIYLSEKRIIKLILHTYIMHIYFSFM